MPMLVRLRSVSWRALSLREKAEVRQSLSSLRIESSEKGRAAKKQDIVLDQTVLYISTLFPWSFLVAVFNDGR